MSFTRIIGIGSTNQTKYKLVYFDGRGRAETARILFALAGQNYEDVRLDDKGWLKLKPDTPFGEMPILELDGRKIAQSHAIERLLAKKFGMYGSNDIENAKVDMIVDCTEDITKAAFGFMFEKDQSKKAELQKQFTEEKMPQFFGFLEKMIGPYGVCVGKKLTLADLSIYNTVSMMAGIGIDNSGVLKKNPKLKALYERVEKNPKVAEWVAKRPKTPF